MMEGSSQNLSINLGKKHESAVGSLFLKWSINSGKIIVVVVELIALGALSYRFLIDQRIIDLNDKIKRQQIFIEALHDKEVLYKNLQTRLSIINSISTETNGKIKFLKSLLFYLNSNEFSSSSLSVSGNNVIVEGETVSIFTLNNFIDQIKKNPDVVSITLDDLTSLDQGIRFKINAQLKEDKIII